MDHAYAIGIHFVACLLLGLAIALHRRARHARSSAERAARTRSEFLAAVSHEIRTPMNAVAGMADLLLESALTPQQRECALTIRESASLQLAILGDILDSAKIEAGKLTLESVDFSPAELASRIHLAFLGAAREKGLQLDLKTSNLPESVLGDPLRVRQVLAYLVSNAIKFTPAGSVAIAVETVGEGGAAHLAFSVADTGIGIEPAALTRIFEHFKQADGSNTRRFGGLGLGLGISRSLVALMGGSIHVDSDPGRGSRFWFWLPLRPARGAGLQACLAKLEPNNLPVLVAEDNPVNRKVALALLRSLGVTAEVAIDGFEAVAKCSAKPYAAVLMDCHMPGMDGCEATRRIRALNRERMPIIALTAGAEEVERQAAFAAGMDDFLAKPVRRQALEQMLHKWGGPPGQPRPAVLPGVAPGP